MFVAWMPVCVWLGGWWWYECNQLWWLHNDDEVDNIDDVVDADADDGDDANDEDEKVNLLILVFFQNPVGVEHPSILHIFDIWTRGGGL